MLTPIPTPLCAWLTLLAQAVPNRSALTFLELLLGAMITDRGFVTEALLAITPRRKWPTYFKWLEGGKWSWIAVAQRLCKILVTHFAPPVLVRAPPGAIWPSWDTSPASVDAAVSMYTRSPA